MALSGVDVSHWQEGLDVAELDCDFVICKASQGTGYADPCCAGFVEAALESGKLVGLYHYLDGSGAEEEAEHFLDVAWDWLGRAVLCLDWEEAQNAAWGDEGYLRDAAQRVIDLTGAKPLIYCSLSSYPWDVAEELGCGRWVAQYADDADTGFQESPWNEGAYDCEVRQYSSHGCLSCFDGAIDLDKAYLTAAEWEGLAVCDEYEDAACADGGPEGTTAELAAAVMRGEYGDGEERRAALGARYAEVQALINAVAAADVDGLAAMVLSGELGDGDVRRVILGARYAVVQAIVNKALGAAYDVGAIALDVIAGAYGNGDARRETLGSLYDEVQAEVNRLVG